ncbi:hypothetical protein D3C76_1523740 [compost metagenome]
MRQASVEHLLRCGALHAGVEGNQQHVILWGNALELNAVRIQMVPDGEAIWHAGALINGADRQR